MLSISVEQNKSTLNKTPVIFDWKFEIVKNTQSSQLLKLIMSGLNMIAGVFFMLE